MQGKIHPIGPFLGINTRLPSTRLMVNEGSRHVGDFLRDAVNVDLTDSSTAMRRQGYSKVLNAPTRCLHPLPDGKALAVQGTSLMLLSETASGLTAVLVSNGLSRTNHVSFSTDGAQTYLTDGVGLWCCDGTQVYRYTVTVPQSAPTPRVSTGGVLPAGLYQMAFSHVAQDGRESAMTPTVTVQVPDKGVISISSTAAPLPLGVVDLVVYMTECNGDVLYRVGALLPGETLTLTSVSYLEMSPTRHLEAMPPGCILRHYLGRMLVADGPILYISQPYAYALYDPVEGFMQFSADIDVIAPVKGGFYVCADKTYFVSGDFESVNEVLPYGAVFASDVSLPDSAGQAWYSHRGLVIGDNIGQVQNKQEGVISVPPSSKAALLYRDERGIRQLLAVLPA
ncbi:hypothetical protein [Comamonas aquatica]|uniref:hypothetical protein n=1 Tax=Comamonas aquatica TaxID=225991 RepID=UPI0034D47211